MKLKLMAGAAVVAFMAASGAARAQDSGWYTAVDLGYDNPGTWHTVSEFPISQSNSVDNNTAPTVITPGTPAVVGPPAVAAVNGTITGVGFGGTASSPGINTQTQSK